MGRSRRDPTEALGAPPPPEGEPAWIVVAPGSSEERRLALHDEEPLRIGSDPDMDVRLEDPYVSRRHAEVRRTADGALLMDLGSRNGTHVENVAVKEAMLRPGAIFRVGQTPIRFEVGEVSGRHELTRFGPAVGRSGAMKKVFELGRKLAATEITVTLLGETGTGKDVLARAIHDSSPRATGPFVVFDCGAVAPTLIESELFGHEKGAFTGAVGERRGAFERASGGTLFLDEIGELSLELQPKLLRALEQGRIQRIGAEKEIAVDVRVVAATNRQLDKEVKAGRFREDLYFRLAAAVVHIPPLRERAEDLPDLVETFLSELSRPVTVARDTYDVLTSYDWPGNIRELKNVVLGAAAMVEGTVMEPRHLMFFKPQKRGDNTLDRLPLAGRSLETLERAAIAQTLKRFDGNKTRAAKALGIAPSTLYEKIKRYDL